ncbi:hypothetical protein [Lacticaseibacillus porcinae]|uniref:hypothetical protein n=1 Tax=Lacticaseibacillus porcinae TaxID=1123687 RepID=UPI000F77A490|nr:hypothetical protein [Lacticaseibacillus porcinae]
MKYSRLLKVTAPSTWLSCGAAVIALMLVEIALPLWEDPTEKITVSWVMLSMLLGWVAGIMMCQQVLGIGFVTGTSRKTMILTQWTHGTLIALGFSAFALIVQRLLVSSSLKLSSQMTNFPHFMEAGGMISSFFFLTLVSLVCVAIGSLAGASFIYLPTKVIIPVTLVAIIMIMPMLVVIGFIGVFGAQQLWPGVLDHTWVWLLSLTVLTAILALADYLVYQYLDAPEQIRRY